MSKKIVFTFGRFNPPTTGHFLLATKVKQEASRRGADHVIYGSSSQDAARNPLNSRQKLRFMKKVLKGFNVKIDSGVANPYDALSKLDKEGYTDVVMVVGADRVNEFKRGMKKYIGPNKLYKFKTFEVVSAGERDPDADDVTGMSASKMRAVAKEGNIAAFKLGVPQHVSTNDVSAFFKAVQTGMKIKPFVAENWFDYDEFVEFLSEQNTNEATIPSSIAQDEKAMLGDAINATSNYLQYGHLKRAKADNIHTFRPNEIKTAMQHLQQKKITGIHQGTYRRLYKSMGNLAAGVEHEEENELNELTIQARHKMARNAKRTAKKRQRKREMKKKRKKSDGDIKKKAQKNALTIVRNKMIKGMKWNEMSFSQRESIGQKLKKKKTVIGRLAKRLVPQARADEKERLKKVREKMTTNDPAKAVEKFEDINIDFETEVLNESRLLSFSEASQVAAMKQQLGDGEEGSAYYSKAEDKKKTTEQETFYIVKNKKTKKTQVVVKFNKAEHIPVSDGAASAIKGNAKKASEEEDFDWKSSKSAMAKLGIRKAVGGGERGTSKEGGTRTIASAKKGKKRLKKVEQPVSGEQPVEAPLTDAQKRTQANMDKAGETDSKLAAAQSQDTWDQYKQGKEDISAEMDAVEMQNYATDMGQKMGIPQKEPTQDQAKKLKSTKDGQFEDWHDAVDVETAVVAVANGCHLKETGEEMRKCLVLSKISDKDIIKLAQSPTLIPAARRMWDRVGMQLPEGMVWEHTGKGLGEVALSQTYDMAGASNKTPKTDLRACNPKTGKCMNLSMKMGPGQLMSGQAGESIGTYRVVLDRMRGCQGRTIDKDGNDTGVACNRKLGAGDKALIKRMEQIIKNVEETFINSKVSEGMGPIGWWLGKGIGGKRPSWWDRTGPGRPGMDISWEDAKGKDPNDHPEWFMEDKAELEKNMAIIQDANKKMKVIKKELGEIFSSGKFGQEMKEHVMYEAMTGCGKFCEGCCGTDICKECQSIHAATHLIVGNKDGTAGMIQEIQPPGSKMMKEMSGKTTVDVRFKTTSGVKSAKGWFKEMEPELFEKIKFMTKKEQKGIADGDEEYAGLAKIRKKALTKKEHKRLLELIAYTGQKLPDGTTKWEDLTDKQKKKILSKAEIKMGVYSINSVSGMNTTFGSGGPAYLQAHVEPPKFRTFLEHNGDKENGGEYSLKDAMKWVGHDPGRLAEFLGLEPEISAPHESYGDVFEQETSGQSNTITIDGETKTIPIAKDDEYKDYQQNWEDGERDEPQSQQEDKINEDFRLLSERAKSREIKRSDMNKSFKDYTYNVKENTATLKDSYEFKDSSIHGMGTFAGKGIEEDEVVGLYYLNLLNENENAPQYQRTDFCRFTNHSKHIPNIALVEMYDGNFYTYATKDIKEGDEILIDYYHVFDTILPALKEAGEVVPEVLRWTEGYDDMEIPPDGFGDLRDELAHFAEINEAVDIITGEMDEGKIRDKIDDFKFYTSSSQKSKRKKERKRKKKVRKYNKMVGIMDDVQSDNDTELEEARYERQYNRGDTVRGRRGDHAGQKYVVHKGNDSPISDMTVKIGNNKVKVSPNDFDLLNRKELPEDTTSSSTTASETDAKRAAYLKQYGAKPEQRERRSARTNARNKLIRSGRASVGDGKDLDHKDGNPLNNSSKNLRMVNRSFNRGRDNNKWRKKTNEEHGAGEMGTDKLLKRYIKDTPFMSVKKGKK